ncbi:hypothetical protein GCM10008994_13500 [Halorubrum ejinorense]|uniref:Uncharacterized protein n=2 Tax=Halorubrum ejinorense TaxID=425309 RepID=A0AAV3SQL8_9EURY
MITIMTSNTTDDVDDGAVTTETDYRWRWLSTIWVLVYGLGFPAWALTVGTDVGAALLSALILAWGGTVVYVIGPENVRAFRELRSGTSEGD